MKRISRRRFLKTLGLSGAGMVGLSGYGFAVEPDWRLEVTRYRVTPPNWPRDLNLSIGVIADVHAGGPAMPAERIRSIVAHTNSLKPDVIVLLGDFAASHRFKTRSVAPQVWSEVLGELSHRSACTPSSATTTGGTTTRPSAHARAPCSAGACWSARACRSTRTTWCVWPKTAARSGSRASATRWLSSTVGARVPGRTFDGVHDLDGTLAKVTDDAPVILLAHEPDIFPRVPPRVSLTLSGHTHGGQVRVFGYSPMVPSRYGNRYAYGHIVEDDRHLVVSGGLGCSILPVRIGVPPEIVMVDVAAA